MRVNLGQPCASRTFDPVAAGWTALRGQGDKRYVWMALGLGLPFTLGSMAMALHYRHEWRALFDAHPWGLAVFLVTLILLVPVHEFVHAVAYGCGLRSPDLILGVWPQRGLVYVLYDSPLPRDRVLFMLAAPFVLLTVLLLCMLVFLSAEIRSLVAFILVAHTSACGGDAITFVRLWRQAPPHALIHNQGSTTYWGAVCNAT